MSMMMAILREDSLNSKLVIVATCTVIEKGFTNREEEETIIDPNPPTPSGKVTDYCGRRG